MPLSVLYQFQWYALHIPRQHGDTLLEPITQLEVMTPSEYTSKVLQLVSSCRGQILSYERRDDWQGWDKVTVYLPQAQMQEI